jgi:uncharacterized protein GlcG (DUF336 family)
MSILSFLFGAKPGRRRPAPSSEKSFRPALEILETRETPALVSSQVAPLIVPPGGPQLQAGQVSDLLQRAAAADGKDDGIVVIVDRSGRILGTRVEGNVSTAVTSNPGTLTFAIDGALALARTAAFFSNNQAPLTSRTIGFISQSTTTEREVNSNPSIMDPNSTGAGPGLVAAIETGGHFPPGVFFTPQVDLSGIELTNRDTTLRNGVLLPSEFNAPLANIPGGEAFPTITDSYGFISGLQPNAQPRGIGTLPGGVPIFENGVLVGGIGVFFPGQTGFASEENSILSSNYNSALPDRSLEAEYVAYAALGGVPGESVGTLGGVAVPSGIALPNGSINLVGVTLNIYGPGGTSGPLNLINEGDTLTPGNPNSGVNKPVDAAGDTLIGGVGVPFGWLVTPHAGVGISADQVVTMIDQGIAQADATRAAIRLPLSQHTEQVFAVADSTGAVLGLYRMPDSTVFSIDVAVAKARNVAYYDDPAQLLAVDQVPGLPSGTSLTARTFQYLEQPRYPLGVDGTQPGPFSILNGPNVNTYTALNQGPGLAAKAYDGTVYGYAAFHLNSNFHAETSPLNQNGVVFFPGSSGVYSNNGTKIVGGFGVSGDGVTEDDIITAAGGVGFGPATNLKADQFFIRGARLPYQEFDRNAEG